MFVICYEISHIFASRTDRFYPVCVLGLVGPAGFEPATSRLLLWQHSRAQAANHNHARPRPRTSVHAKLSKWLLNDSAVSFEYAKRPITKVVTLTGSGLYDSCYEFLRFCWTRDGDTFDARAFHDVIVSAPKQGIADKEHVLLFHVEAFLQFPCAQCLVDTFPRDIDRRGAAYGYLKVGQSSLQVSSDLQAFPLIRIPFSLKM